MHIARQKIKENIAEYILYMWQIEDAIRAFHFNIEDIEFNIIRLNYQDEAVIEEAKDWYSELIRKMKSEKLEKKGHLSELNDIINELYFLHSTLLNISADNRYKQIFEEALPVISEFKERSNSSHMNDVEVCLNGLYSKLLMRLRKMKISKETEEAFEQFRKVIAYLTMSYHKMKRGDLNFHLN
ncbi:MAG: DUF4924 family protein [Bacteroidota bacterium]